MSVDAIGQGYPNQARVPSATVGAEQEQPGSSAEISKLSAEIKQAESEMKETTKEVQKAVSESVGGSSEKVQLLQNKILMKQMKIKEMELPSKAAAVQPSVNRATPPRVDRYVAGEDRADEPDNVYRMEEKDGARTIVFNRPEEEALTGR